MDGLRRQFLLSASLLTALAVSQANALPIVNNGDTGLNARNKINAGLAVAKELLLANRTYYVRSDGNNSNTGLVDNAGGAWLTLQYASDTIANSIAFNGKIVRVLVRTGTYAGVSFKNLVGNGFLYFEGNPTTPANVIVTNGVTSGGSTVGSFFAEGTNECAVFVNGFRLAPTAAPCLDCDPISAGISTIVMGNAWDFSNGNLTFAGNQSGGPVVIGNIQDQAYTLTIDGAALTNPSAFMFALEGSRGSLFSTITITGNPAFSIGFLVVSPRASITAYPTISGTATGKKFRTRGYLESGTITSLPGNAAGQIDSGGLYIDFSGATPKTYVGAMILPTSDPGISGALWNNAGTPAISV